MIELDQQKHMEGVHLKRCRDQRETDYTLKTPKQQERNAEYVPPEGLVARV